jgi:cell division protein FtsL
MRKRIDFYVDKDQQAEWIGSVEIKRSYFRTAIKRLTKTEKFALMVIVSATIYFGAHIIASILAGRL